MSSTLEYDALNRLTSLGSQSPSGPVASYAYTLGAAGNRTGVTELSGRKVTCAYDNLYRLTSETIAGSLSGVSGSLAYQYDGVGNRKSIASTLPTINTWNYTYDANDRIAGFAAPSYDNDGNIAWQAGTQERYDFENHLVGSGGITYQYDGDGNRVSKTMAGVTTNYLVDDQANPTGYAQVIEEITAGWTAVSYAYGPMRAYAFYPQQAQLPGFTGNYLAPLRYYGYDGHGSVRYLTDNYGAVVQTYDYDAFGNLINQTSTPSNWPGVNYLPVTVPPNTMMFAGEQYDPDLGLYYNRARYLDTHLGRFWGMDTEAGNPNDPTSLHKYLYTSGNPVGRIDPSGNDDIIDMVASMAIDTTLNSMAITSLPGTPAGPAYTSAAALFTPASVWNTLENNPPDAVEVGISGSVTGGRGFANASLSAGFGLEELFSMRGNGAATYLSTSVMGTWGGTASSATIGVTFGLVYNCPLASSYSGPFFAASGPVGKLPAKLGALPSLAASALYADLSNGSGGLNPATMTAIMYALGTLGSLNSTATATVFFGPTSWPPTLGILFGSPSGGIQAGVTADILLSKDVAF